MTRKLRASASGAGFGVTTIKALLTHALVGLVCVYLGLLLGMSTCTSEPPNETETVQCPSTPACPVCATNTINEDSAARSREGPENVSTDSIFPPSLKNMFAGLSTVPREEFNEKLEIGVPWDDTLPGSKDVLILYDSERAMPQTKTTIGMSTDEALKNCNTVKVILQEPGNKQRSTQCIAIAPQWESFHIHKFMRLPASRGGLDKTAPLRYVSRSHNDKGQNNPVPDLKIHTNPSYEVLVEYLQNLKQLLEKLGPICKEMFEKSTLDKGPVSGKTVLVQVCNYGQVELWHNFICNARAKGLDTSQILLFATDQATYDLAKQLGIPAFFDEAIFGSMPESAAKVYGDRTFTKMMMAKVYCVHLVLSLGYHVLFQDVDVIWYKNPLSYFDSEEAVGWDMMYQDDGARSHRYAPYSPNTGFYFVRNNKETMFFFGMLLRGGDVIAKSTSHQAALTAIMNEHVSWKGLRVKVWTRGEKTRFPGGFEYHRRKELMRALVSGNSTVDPLIFHMSWTKNKDNKKLFYQQAGEWFTTDDCLSGPKCCLEEANIVCHYRDKPSKIPCTDSPPIDKGRPSFW